MKFTIKHIGGLERKLLAYFLLIAVAALMIGVEFVVEMNSLTLKQQLWEKMSSSEIGHEFSKDSPAFDPIEKLRNKIIIMFAVLTVVVAIVLIMFIRNITAPLQHMVNIARQINRGDLSRIVRVESTDEIGTLGSAINELTSNLQEVAVHVRMTYTGVSEKIMKLEQKVEELYPDKKDTKGKAKIEQIRKDIKDIENEINTLQEIASSFKFLSTDMNRKTDEE
jgi:methyl-accepting chemotaxis protein